MDTTYSTDTGTEGKQGSYLGCRVKKPVRTGRGGRTLQDWVALQITPTENNKLKELKDFLALINVTDCTIEDSMHFRQIQLAIEKGDSRAYSAIMEMLYGKKIQEGQDKTRPVYAIYPADKETERLIEET